MILSCPQQLLCHGGDRTGRGGGAENGQALREFEYEPAQPQKIAADQVDSCQTRGQAKALFGQPRHSTRTARRSH